MKASGSPEAKKDLFKMTYRDIQNKRSGSYRCSPLSGNYESQRWIDEKAGLLSDYQKVTQEALNRLAALYPEERFSPILSLIVDTLNNDYKRFKVLLNTFPEFK